MKMKELFDRGEFVVSAEVGPPKGIHVDAMYAAEQVDRTPNFK